MESEVPARHFFLKAREPSGLGYLHRYWREKVLSLFVLNVFFLWRRWEEGGQLEQLLREGL